MSSKGALKNAPRPRSAITSVITGPVVLPSPKDAVVPLVSIDRWQGRSTAGPFHYRTQRDPLCKGSRRPPFRLGQSYCPIQCFRSDLQFKS